MPAAALSDESRAVVRRFFSELWNNGNLNVADELIDMDAVNHDPAGLGSEWARRRLSDWSRCIATRFLIWCSKPNT